MGNSTSIKVPISWMPVDLTTQATKASILANPQFRRLVSGEMLRLVDSDQAREVAESSAGRKELRRIFELDSSPMGSSELNMPKELRRENSNGVSGFVLNLVNRADAVDEDSVLSALLGQETILTQDDFRYLAENSTMSGVKNWAVERLAD